MGVTEIDIQMWESDKVRPDLGVLSKLSKELNVSTNVLFNDGESVERKTTYGEVKTEVTPVTTVPPITETTYTPTSTAIGYCTECGIMVTEDNVGRKEPKIVCKKCVEAEAENKRREVRETEEKENYTRSRMRFRRNLSIIIGLVFGIAALVGMIFIALDMPESDRALYIGVAIFMGYAVFAFVAQMFFDGVVRNLLIDWVSKTVNFPGLIFSWDLDGILWLIGMKILFAILGFLAGVLFAILGVTISLIIAPFVYPFALIKQNVAIKNCDDSDFE